MRFLLSGQVVSNLQELQSLTADPTADKEKQKAEFKHIQQQKQRALSDLFKMLSEMGQFHLQLFFIFITFLS